MIFPKIIPLVIVLTVFFHPSAHARDAEKGLEIAKEIKRRDLGWSDTLANTQMILRAPDGRESVRELRIKTLEVDNDGDKALTVFDEPRDVAGTAFLSFSHIQGADDQWIYLPAISRVKRISTKNKSGPFMGSEFAYEDMTSFEVEKFAFNYLRDETYRGMDCFVVEQVPNYEYSGYSRMVAWIDKEHYRVHKIDYYDVKGDLLKELTLNKYQQYLGQYWRALRADMQNFQTGKSTSLVTGDIRFRTGLDEADFNKNALRRVN